MNRPFLKLTSILCFSWIVIVSSCVNNSKSIVRLEESYSVVLSKMKDFNAQSHPLGWLSANDENGETPIYEGFELQDGTKYLLLFHVKLLERKQVGDKKLKAIFTVKKGSKSYDDYGEKVELINLKNHLVVK